MKRILTAVLCLAVPGLFFLNAWQGYRTNVLSDRVAELERQQQDLLAANRDIIGQIAFETSPERVAQKAAGLGLVPLDPSRETRLQAPAGAPVSADPATDAPSSSDAAGQNVTEYRNRGPVP